VSFPWERFPWAEAILSFTRGLGAAKSGDLAAARREAERLAALREALVQAKNGYWADQVEVQRRAVSAMLARAEGRDEDALGLMHAAADLEATMDKHPVTPAPVVPARELLGDLLLDLDQPAQALREYEATLATEPNRFRSFVGAARAAELSGDTAKAGMYYRNVVALGGRADTPRPELQQAHVFMAK
jgi:tetratricopeptide (TPR) repeat protein